MQTQTTQPLPRYSQYTVRLMAPRVWRTLASATQALWPTFGNHRIYQLQPAETKSAPNVIRLLSAETGCPPKVPIYSHSAPKPNPKPKFGRPLTWVDSFIATLLKFFTALVCPLLMHALENFEDLSVQGQGLGAKPKTKGKDFTNTIYSRSLLLATRWLHIFGELSMCPGQLCILLPVSRAVISSLSSMARCMKA